MASLGQICITNKFFIMAISASFAFTILLFNITTNEIITVKADILHDNTLIIKKLDLNSSDIQNILISQARMEEKINQLYKKTP